MNREEIVRLLGGTSRKTTSRYTRGKSTISETGEEVSLPLEPLALDVSAFWDGSSLPDDVFAEVRIPPVTAALPKRLGSFPFWRGEQRFLDAIDPIYIQASPRGMDLFLI